MTFDVYGTLVDWRYSIGSFLSRYVSRDSIEEYFECDFYEVRSYKPYKEVLRTCLRRVMERRGLSYSDFLGEAFIRNFARSPPFPDTIYGLIMLRNSGFKTGVISNTDRDLIDVTLHGFRDLFDYIITAEDLKIYKPDPRAFRRALDIIGLDPEYVLHVSAYPQYDLVPASSINIRSVHVNRYGYDWKPEIRSLDELVSYIKSLK